MIRRIGVVLLLGLAVSACDWSALVERTAPAGAVAFAKDYVALFRKHDFETIEKQTDPTIREPDLRAKLARMAAFLPDEDPKTITLVSWRTTYASGQTVVRLEFQYEFPSAWAAVNMLLKQQGDDFLVNTVNFTRLNDSLQSLNRFTLRDKPFASYAFLAYALATLALIGYATVTAFRTPIPKRKWLWIVFILLGFCSLTLNWTTSQFSGNLLSFYVLGVSFASGPYSPVLITASLPLGAIVFLARRRRWRATAGPPATPLTV